MLDLAYVVGSMLFFALMLWYVRGCEVLGRAGVADPSSAEPNDDRW